MLLIPITHSRRSGTFIIASSDAPSKVKAGADYVCDGTADNVQIQAAIDALPAYAPTGGGGSVILTAGRFNIAATINLRGAMLISGQGVYATALYMSAGADCDMFTWAGGSSNLFLQMEKMHLYGRKDISSGGCINCPSSGGYYLQDVHLKDLFINAFTGKGVYSANCWGWELHNCVVEYCDDFGVDLVGNDGLVSNCKIMSNGENNLKLFTNTSVVNCRLGPSNTAESKYAVEISAYNNLISNCQINTSGGTVLSNWGGIKLNGAMFNYCNVITGNIILSKGTGYGVYVSTGAVGNIVKNNCYMATGVGNIYDAGVGTVRDDDGTTGPREVVTTGSPALITKGITRLNSTTGAITAILADGVNIGDRKIIYMHNSSTVNSSTVTIANHATSDPEVATFDADYEYLELEWNGTDWTTIANTCTFV